MNGVILIEYDNLFASLVHVDQQLVDCHLIKEILPGQGGKRRLGQIAA